MPKMQMHAKGAAAAPRGTTIGRHAPMATKLVAAERDSNASSWKC